MGRVTTHVLDTARGLPAAGLRVELWGDAGRIADRLTNADGRCDGPLVEGAGAGVYELRFHAGDYLRGAGVVLADPPFLDVIPIRFGLGAAGHAHVPLLLSPYGYSTYRGS